MDAYARESAKREAEERHFTNVKRAHVPEEFKGVKLTTCSEAVQQWTADTLRGGKRDLVLFGLQGRGKTHNACGALNAILPARRGLFTSQESLVDTVTDTMFQRGETVQSAVAQFTVPPVLVIDDLGAAKPTDRALDSLFAVIKRRYEMRRPTIYTTMYPFAELASRLSIPGEEQRAAGILSRLQSAVWVQFDGKDWRAA